MDCIHTTFFLNGHLLEDSQIINIAIEEERVIITKDSDFSDYFLLKGFPPRVLLLEFGNIGNKELLRLFDKHLDTLITAFEEGSGMVTFGTNQIVGY